MQEEDRDTFLDIRIDTENEVPIIAVEGSLDIYTTHDFKPVMDRLFNEGAARLIVDISGLSILDSSGIGALVSMHVRLKTRKSGFFAITGANDQVCRLLKVTRLDSLFRMYPTVVEALLDAEKNFHPENAAV